MKFRTLLPILPAVMLLTVLLGAGLFYGLAQSLGYLSVIGQRQLNLDAYLHLLRGEGAIGREFWVALGFSLWVSLSATLLSAVGALVIATWLSRRPLRLGIFALNWNLAFPHLVWAVGLLLALSQSGLLSRWAATLGLISEPSQFPILVRDRYGLGIILHYASKEIPFLTLLLLAVLRTQPEGYLTVAKNLGASSWQRFRWVTLPLLRPALTSGALLVFAYTFGAYEAPALLGVRYPRMLPVLALDAFLNSDLRVRPEGMAISLIITALALGTAILARRRGEVNP